MKVGIILKSPLELGKVEEDLVIFADAGFKFKEQLKDKKVLAVVGDFDSLGKAPNGEKIVALQKEKNFTDGEFALRYAVENGATDISIYGAFGGKIEHVLGNITLLAIAKALKVNAKLVSEKTVVKLIDKTTKITVEKGATISLIPYGGDCSFAKSFGLYYPLNDLTLTPFDTRGISNLAIEEKIEICISNGTALLIYDK